MTGKRINPALDSLVDDLREMCYETPDFREQLPKKPKQKQGETDEPSFWYDPDAGMVHVPLAWFAELNAVIVADPSDKSKLVYSKETNGWWVTLSVLNNFQVAQERQANLCRRTFSWMDPLKFPYKKFPFKK